MQHLLIILSALFISISLLSVFYIYQEKKRTSHQFLRPLFYLLLFYSLLLIRVFVWNYLLTTVFSNYSDSDLRYYEANINLINWLISIGMFSGFFFFGFSLSAKKISPVFRNLLIGIMIFLIILGFTHYSEILFNYTIQAIDDLYPFMTRLPTILTISFLIYLIYYSRQIKESNLQKSILVLSSVYALLLIYGLIKIYFVSDNIFLLFVNSSEHILFSIFPIVWYKIYFRNTTPIPDNSIPVSNTDFASLCENSKISEREKEVLRLLLQGKRNKEIQEALFISASTVKNHLYNIYRKLNVNSQTQLMHKYMNINIG